MKDMVGRSVEVGDYLIDDRGKLFLIQSTPDSYQKEQVIIVAEYRPRSQSRPSFLRQKLALKVTEDRITTPQKILKDLWKFYYDKYVGPQQREEVRARRANFQGRRKQ